MDVGDAVAIGVRQSDPGRHGQIGTEAIGSRQTRTLAKQDHHHVRAEQFPDLIAERNPGPCRNGHMTNCDVVGTKHRNQPPQQFDGVSMDCRRRQTIADDKGQLAGFAGARQAVAARPDPIDARGQGA